MSFIPISKLLNMDAQYMKLKAINTLEHCERLNDIYTKTKDTKIKNLMKKYKNESKKDIKNFERSKELAKETLKELNDMQKKNKKILT